MLHHQANGPGFAGLAAFAGLCLALLAFGCQSAEQAELEALRKEVAELRAGNDAQEPAAMDAEKHPDFEFDPLRGTLAGLVPGDTLDTARERFGPETRSRSWSSEGRMQVQYEWELEPGLFLRLNAESNGVLKKVAVALNGTRPTNIPVFEGIHLGQATFVDLRDLFADQDKQDDKGAKAGKRRVKDGPPLATYLQFWGARGLYTIIQRRPVPNTRRYMEFAFQLPSDLSPGQLNEIGETIQMTGDGAILEPILGDRTPYQLALGMDEGTITFPQR